MKTNLPKFGSDGQEDPDQIQICEFRGQNFELVAD